MEMEYAPTPSDPSTGHSRQKKLFLKKVFINFLTFFFFFNISFVFFHIISSDPKGPGYVSADPTNQNQNIAVTVSNAAQPGAVYSCYWWFLLDCHLRTGLVGIGSMVVYVGALIFNLAMEFTVIKMGYYINGNTGIEAAWIVLRDLANLGLVYALLLIGISTILRINRYGYRVLLARIIIVALLVNFSLFLTKGVVEVSNVLANGVYKLIAEPTGPGCNGGVSTVSSRISECSNAGISAAIVQTTRISSIYDGTPIVENSNVGGVQNISQGFLVMVFLIITAFVLLGGALMLITRYIILIFLMILSPLAFVAWTLPKTEHYAKEWWGKLINQSFFAPFYLLMIWVSLSVLSGISPNLTGSLGQAFSGSGIADVLLNFCIVTGLMVGSLVVSKKLGAYGADTAINWTSRSGGRATFGTLAFLQRHTVGRLANRMATWQRPRAFLQGSVLGRSVLKGIRTVGSSSFDVRNTELGRGISRSLGGANLGKVGGEGGYSGLQKRRQDEREAARRDAIREAERVHSGALSATRRREIAGNIGNTAVAQNLRQRYVDRAVQEASLIAESKAIEIEELERRLEANRARMQLSDTPERQQELEAEANQIQNQLQSARAAIPNIDQVRIRATQEASEMQFDERRVASTLSTIEETFRNIQNTVARNAEEVQRSSQEVRRTEEQLAELQAENSRQDLTPEQRNASRAQLESATRAHQEAQERLRQMQNRLRERQVELSRTWTDLQEWRGHLQQYTEPGNRARREYLDRIRRGGQFMERVVTGNYLAPNSQTLDTYFNPVDPIARAFLTPNEYEEQIAAIERHWNRSDSERLADAIMQRLASQGQGNRPGNQTPPAQPAQPR